VVASLFQRGPVIFHGWTENQISVLYSARLVRPKTTTVPGSRSPRFTSPANQVRLSLDRPEEPQFKVI
ncbi:hypothetical protein B0H10DRAFT_1980641, partial [Mycena sp. CBHHK59/15]